MNPSAQSYLLDIGIFLGILAGVALMYILLLGSLCWLLSRWQRKGMLHVLWLSIVISIVVAVIAVPLFQGIAGLFRYDPPGGILSGMGRHREDWQAYASAARIAFFASYSFLVVLGGVIGYAHAPHIHQSRIAATVTALAVFFYL